MVKKLVIITFQEGFLQLSHEQITAIAGDFLEIRAVSLNNLTRFPPRSDETILYCNPGLKSMIERVAPECGIYFHAKRELLIFNMKELLHLDKPSSFLVVNDNKENTDGMLHDLEALGLVHDFSPYYPEQQFPENIDYIITSGERLLIPKELRDIPVFDVGLRFISLASVFALFDHFAIDYNPAKLAGKYMQTMMVLAEKWPGLGNSKFISQRLGPGNEKVATITFADLVVRSHAMKKFVSHAEKIALTDKPVHVYGEVGTGKRRISQAIHNGSSRFGMPFVLTNCSTRSPGTLEKELFGWEASEKVYSSLFELARGGTLCIEEIGEMDRGLKAKLVQVILEKRIVRADGTGYVDIDVPRIITTSSKRPVNRDLLLLISYCCRIPTLNERAEDFEALLFNYLKRHLPDTSARISKETIAVLKAYHWRGNVQELYNVLQYMTCTAEGELTREELPYYIAGYDGQGPDSKSSPVVDDRGDVTAICREIEKHGFLTESIKILSVYLDGKEKNIAYGRKAMRAILADQEIGLSTQQLRLRLETLNGIGLLVVRPGRGGTTISEKGEYFLRAMVPSITT